MSSSKLHANSYFSATVSKQNLVLRFGELWFHPSFGPQKTKSIKIILNINLTQTYRNSPRTTEIN